MFVLVRTSAPTGGSPPIWEPPRTDAVPVPHHRNHRPTTHVHSTELNPAHDPFDHPAPLVWWAEVAESFWVVYSQRPWAVGSESVVGPSVLPGAPTLMLKVDIHAKTGLLRPSFLEVRPCVRAGAPSAAGKALANAAATNLVILSFKGSITSVVGWTISGARQVLGSEAAFSPCCSVDITTGDVSCSVGAEPFLAGEFRLLLLGVRVLGGLDDFLCFE